MHGRLPRVPPAASAASADDVVRDGRDARWESHREERRRLILDAAIELVQEAPPGAELRLQDVAERAGLVRTVVQRHFGGRVALVRAVQADVLDQAFSLITGPVDFNGTLSDVAAHMIGIAVEWVDEHPSLHHLVERELGDGEPSELSKAIESYADFLVQIPVGLAQMRGVPLADDAVEEIRLMFAGIIGQVRATMGHWARQRPRVLSSDRVVDLLVAAVAAQVAERGSAYGLRLDADEPLMAGD